MLIKKRKFFGFLNTNFKIKTLKIKALNRKTLTFSGKKWHFCWLVLPIFHYLSVFLVNHWSQCRPGHPRSYSEHRKVQFKAWTAAESDLGPRRRAGVCVLTETGKSVSCGSLMVRRAARLLFCETSVYQTILKE